MNNMHYRIANKFFKRIVYKHKLRVYPKLIPYNMNLGSKAIAYTKGFKPAVYISLQLLNHNNLNDILHIILHECAHVLQMQQFSHIPQYPHGYYFKKACKTIGVHYFARALFYIQN